MPQIVKNQITCAEEAILRVMRGDELHAVAFQYATDNNVLINDVPDYHTACRMHQSAAALMAGGDREWPGESVLHGWGSATRP